MEDLLKKMNVLLQNKKSRRDVFNIFSCIGIQRAETRLHTPMLTQLLNPKSLFNTGRIFLDSFLIAIGENPLLYKEPKIVQEYFISDISIDRTQGGQIDIVIFDGNVVKVVIENKIDAIDQEGQIARYHNKFQDAKLVYLTLDGRRPSMGSVNYDMMLSREVVCISYRYDLLKLFENNIQNMIESGCDLHVLSIIVQYIETIKHITGQGNNKVEKEKMLALMIENIDECFEIYTNIDLLRNHLALRLKEQIEMRLRNNVGKVFVDKDFTIKIEDQISGLLWIITSDSIGLNRNGKEVNSNIYELVNKLGKDHEHGNTWVWFINKELVTNQDTRDNPEKNIINEKYAIEITNSITPILSEWTSQKIAT